MCVSQQRRAIFRHLNFKKCSEPEMFCTFWLAKCAFRHSGVQFLDISTSKSAPNLRCFVHFDLQNVRFATAACIFLTSELQKVVRAWGVLYILTCEMCVSPQRRAIFRHLNFKKCSKHEVLCTFWLRNVRFAKAACNFWFLSWAVSSAPAALTGLLFDWPDPRIIEKTQHFATSLTFRADVSSFMLTFWLLHLLSTDLTTLLLFNSPYCRKFLFKLPSITRHWKLKFSFTEQSLSSCSCDCWPFIAKPQMDLYFVKRFNLKQKTWEFEVDFLLPWDVQLVFVGGFSWLVQPRIGAEIFQTSQVSSRREKFCFLYFNHYRNMSWKILE